MTADGAVGLDDVLGFHGRVLKLGAVAEDDDAADVAVDGLERQQAPHSVVN